MVPAPKRTMDIDTTVFTAIGSVGAVQKVMTGAPRQDRTQLEMDKTLTFFSVPDIEPM